MLAAVFVAPHATQSPADVLKKFPELRGKLYSRNWLTNIDGANGRPRQRLHARPGHAGDGRSCASGRGLGGRIRAAYGGKPGFDGGLRRIKARLATVMEGWHRLRADPLGGIAVEGPQAGFRSKARAETRSRAAAIGRRRRPGHAGVSRRSTSVARADG